MFRPRRRHTSRNTRHGPTSRREPTPAFSLLTSRDDRTPGPTLVLSPAEALRRPKKSARSPSGGNGRPLLPAAAASLSGFPEEDGAPSSGGRRVVGGGRTGTDGVSWRAAAAPGYDLKKCSSGLESERWEK
mmetsp:Transcript_6512/g.14073  ORF Transcript_6512/g.14073 Transcript_6512/m.14073 type:complete len:131 (+) Transcript_6512:123-515(+)